MKEQYISSPYARHNGSIVLLRNFERIIVPAPLSAPVIFAAPSKPIPLHKCKSKPKDRPVFGISTAIFSPDAHSNSLLIHQLLKKFAVSLNVGQISLWIQLAIIKKISFWMLLDVCCAIFCDVAKLS